MDDVTSDDNIDFNEEWLYSLRANEVIEAVDILKERLITNVNVADCNGNSALHYCAANNLAQAIIFLLKECKVDYCRPNHSGNTPLQWAVQTNSIDAVREILKHDYDVHREEYTSREGISMYGTFQATALKEEYKLDEETKRYYNIVQFPPGYAQNNRIHILIPNIFGKSILNDAFNASDQNILLAILEHPVAYAIDECIAAKEEAGLERVDVNGISGVVHAFIFKPIKQIVKARELEIKHTQILNERNAEMDHSGEVIWETDLVASQWLAELAKEGKFEGRRVLQLGSGCGLSGIALYLASLEHRKLPMILIFTDVCDTTMSNLHFNIQLNEMQGKSGVSILSLDWTKPSTWPMDGNGNLQTFDIIIGSDLVYDSHLVQPLSNTINHLLERKKGELLYVYRQARDGSKLIPEA
eukprot:XP_001612245.1 hypothetical protein [Babesia bovis T2Bo]